MVNKDGSHGPRATQRELCELYADACIRSLSYLSDVVGERFAFYLAMLVQDATIAANHGRRALRQSNLK